MPPAGLVSRDQPAGSFFASILAEFVPRLFDRVDAH